MAESLTEGTLKTWMKQVGDRVEMDEEVASIETDKVRVAFQLFELRGLAFLDADVGVYCIVLKNAFTSEVIMATIRILFIFCL
jgi:hypothetical protein